jgi:hypothetical protein
VLSGCWGCGAEAEPPACTAANWQTCEAPPSLDSRSQPWPEQRAALAGLADATEYALAHPTEWNTRFGAVALSPKKIYGPEGYGQLHDLELRSHPVEDALARLDAAVARYADLLAHQRGAPPNTTPDPRDAQLAVEGRMGAEQAWTELHSVRLFRDSFGQPEPRLALYAFARASTETQFLATEPGARSARATAAAAFLEERLREWEEMQRARLAGRPEAEVRDAIDAIGAPELRRLKTAWGALESLAVPTVK